MSEFSELPESHRQLEDRLFELGDDGMVMGELEGFLCGVAVSPEPVPQDEWLPLVFGEEALASATTDRSQLRALINARFDEISAELADGGYQPIYEIDESRDPPDVLWEIWISGFEVAMGLRLEAWERLIKSPRESRAQEAALAIVDLLGASDPALGEADKADPDFIAFVNDAPRIIPQIVATLYRAHRLGAPQPVRSAAVGRNDPCPCGSGLKYKRCHGAT